MSAVWLPWVLLSAIIVLTVIVSWSFVAYFADLRNMSSLFKVAAAMSLCLGLLTIQLLPVDIWNLNHGEGDAQSTYAANVRRVYFALFGLLLITNLLFLPLTNLVVHSFSAGPLRLRAASVAKYLIAFLVVAGAMVGGALILGLAVTPVNLDKMKWIQILFDHTPKGDRMAAWIGAFLALIGLPFWCFFGGMGLGALPWLLIRSPSRPAKLERLTEAGITEIDTQIRTLQLSQATGTRLTKAEQKQLDDLQHNRSLLVHRNELLREESGAEKCCGAVRPALVVAGVALLIPIGFVIAAIVSVLSDVVTRHEGRSWRYGYERVDSSFLNPLDWVMVNVSKWYPLDLVVLDGLVVLMFCGALMGMLRVGVGTGSSWYRRTSARTLGLMCAVMAFVSVTLTFLLPYIIPQYSGFGAQTYQYKGSGHACTLDETVYYPTECRVSEAAKFVSSVVQTIPEVGWVLYWSNGATFILFLVGFFRGVANREPPLLSLYERIGHAGEHSPLIIPSV